MDRSDWLRAALEQFEAPLIRYAAGITGDLETARDVVQDTFLRLCRESQARVGNHLAQWLYTVCRNRALDWRRREKRMSSIDEMQIEMAEYEAAAPESRLGRQESVSRILRVVATLPANQREVVRLKFQADLSYREISAVTGLSVTNVGFLLHTALKAVRAAMEKERETAERQIRRVQ